MKKFILVLFAMYILVRSFALAQDSLSAPVVGETIVFGSYEQDNNTENGAEPIEWIVLDVKNGKALLISKYVLDCRRYNDIDGPTNWMRCSIRKWLNGEFFTCAFTEEEASVVLDTTVQNGSSEQPHKDKWTPTICADTVDKVFLLSVKEYSVYFNNRLYYNKNFDTAGTTYANKKGAKIWFWDSRATQLTRSSGYNSSEASFMYGDVMTSKYAQGIRPALWINVSYGHAELEYELYERAHDYEKESRYEEAAIVYEELGNYRDSIALGKNCRYQQALSLKEAEDYEKAIQVFQALGNYRDSYDLTRDCRYRYAEACFNSGEYELAAKLYDEEGQYKDSMEKLICCLDKLGIPVHYFGNNNIQFLHTKTDSGYSIAGASEIKRGDIHYEWELGQFLISDFTQIKDQFTSHPIFVKGFGNTVTLRFWLQQDINCLHGDKNLTISSDKNAFDDELERERTNFGRGTLIIRHRDHQNKSRIIGPYTDYLLAKESTGANTKVELNQEGEYEVALDYEIKMGQVFVGEKFRNYSIRFAFSIQNGDSPVHIFDCANNNELFERDITPNGFSIALVNNNPLNIHVKCYSIHKESSGRLTLNQDFDRIARDKQTFTKEGIYIISITAPGNDDSMERTVIVGDEELREKYDSINNLG